MGKKLLKALSVAIAIIMLSAIGISAAPKTVINAYVTAETLFPQASKVLEARFLNMLSRNFNYDDDFHCTEKMVNNSVIAQLQLRDSNDESFVAEKFISGFMFDMYGIEIGDFSEINTQFPKKEGFVYIVPRGYSQYNHEIVSVNENEDGSYTVLTSAIVETHDNGSVTEFFETLFVKNPLSSYGYNIIYSNAVTVGASL